MIQLIAGVFVCLGVGVVTAGLLRQFGVPAFNTPDSFANILLATLSFQGVTWLLIFNFLRQHKVNWCDAFGLRNANLDKSILLAVVVLAVAVAKALSVMMFFMHLKFERAWKYLLLAPTIILALALPIALRPDIGETYYVQDVPQNRDYDEQQATPKPKHH